MSTLATYMSDAVALGEVTVTARSGVDSKGRMIVFPSDSEVKASGTSISLFQKLMLPGLEANPITRSLTVDRGAPMFLINGVPSSLEDVQSLQPKEIAKIEYSRITPARYADKGTNGLISITLKKRSDGGSFYGWVRSAVTTAFLDANLRSTYHRGPRSSRSHIGIRGETITRSMTVATSGISAMISRYISRATTAIRSTIW